METEPKIDGMEPETEFEDIETEPELTVDPDDEEIDAIWRRYDSARARFERRARSQERKARRDLYQREMGLGYLIYTARRYRRLSQGRLAKEMSTSRNVISRWESGERLPSLLTLEKVAGGTDLEVVIGLRDPEDRDGDLLSLGIVFGEANCTELLMLIDKNDDELRVTPWRLRLVKENPRCADLLL
jgi:transcriptional regulator with XRE-family HTH domain